MVQLDGYSVDFPVAIHCMCERGEGVWYNLDGYQVDYAEAVHGMCERWGRKWYN